MLVVGLFMVAWLWTSAHNYLRFVQAHRLARRGGVISVAALRELLDRANRDELRVRIADLVREHRSLPPTREMVGELRTLEREADDTSAKPELQDAYARLAESLIDRRAGAARSDVT